MEYVTRPNVVQPFISKQSSNSIRVVWSAPDGNVGSYVVLLNSSSSSSNRSPELDSSITSYEFQNLAAGKIYTATVSTRSGNFSEESEPVTNATYPNPPGSIKVKHTTTNSIFIEWAPAHLMDDTDNFSYTVTISNSSWTREYKAKTMSQNLTNLTAGTFHNIFVRTIGPFGLQSESIKMEYVTRPNVVQPFISKQSSNSIRVVWRAPDGNVESYVVLLNSSSSSSRSPQLDSSITSYEFQNLAAGKIYTATVTTRSGNFSEESEPVTNATYPNPPGCINVKHTTTTSIFIEWAPAHLIEEADDFYYTVTISTSSWTREYDTKTMSQNLTDLTAGTIHCISVRTTGPFGLQSEPLSEYVTTREKNHLGLQSLHCELATHHMKYTRPNVVQPFISKQSSNSIRVVWSASDGNVGSYVVLLNSSSSSSRSPQLDSSITSYEFQKLAAGKIYTVTVTTQSGHFSEESEPVTNATYPNPPGPINVKHTTTNSICIEWAPALMAFDSDGFNYTVTISTSSWTREYNTKTTSQDLTDLTPGTFHGISVRTTGPFSLQSESSSEHITTRPNVVQPFISKQSSNSIRVVWRAPNGNVGSYVVLLNSISSSNKSPELDSSITSYEFQKLAAGKIYTVTVTTQSGNFSEESEAVTNATYPNPPGPINVKHTTTNSICIEWAPALMAFDSDGFNYTVTISTSSWTREYNTKTTTQDLTDLTPGTFHGISVRTTGPFSLQSERSSEHITTRPNAVQPFLSKQSSNSIRVAWRAPDGNVGSYVVFLNSSSSSRSPELDSSITSYEFQNLAAGKIYTATVRTQSGNFSEESEPVTNATYPNPPGRINVKHTTTKSIFIEWAPALLTYDSDGFNYTVTISTSSWTRRYDTKTTSQNLTDLTAGTFHGISVRTIGPFGLQSEPLSEYVSTRPNVVQPFISKQSSNSIRVVWGAPDGNVGSYVVLLNSSSSNKSPELDSSITSYEFQNLAAGKIYTVTVTTQSGHFGEESEQVTNATYPNPPGRITITHTTANSIFIEWAPAHLMDDADSFYYTVTIRNSSWTREYKAKNTSQNLTDLTPGIFHNISVRTTGPFGLQSERIKVEYVQTRPDVVQPFISKQSSSSIRVVWRAPDGNVESYVVLLNSSSSSSSNRSPQLNPNITSYEFQNLAAGKIYTATVTTQSGHYSEESERVTNATYPKPPGRINVKHTTTKSIFIEWAPAILTYDSDGFNYTVTISTSSWTRKYDTKTTSQNLTDLTAGTFHGISVRTIGPFGLQSEPLSEYVSTRPNVVQPFISKQSSNSIRVVWSASDGNVGSYVVLLNSSSSSNKSPELDSSITSYEFQNLAAGKIYTVTVTTQSGHFGEESEQVTNATYPNPPGHITIAHTTANSIFIEWAPAHLMDDADSFYYTVTIRNSSWTREYKAKTTSQNLTDLTPGTFHNISVRTTGPFGLQSECIQIRNAITIPAKVADLNCEPGHFSLSLNWQEPFGVWTVVEVNVNGGISQQVRETELMVVGLQPAQTYIISVTSLSGSMRSSARRISCQTHSTVIWISLLVLTLLGLLTAIGVALTRRQNRNWNLLLRARFHLFEIPLDEQPLTGTFRELRQG
ncbi:receptor-type tyrosine-protein phosphatase beta-like [Sardina pilchardus]|uniref:receptor-type tyrosine-protein phosphatase beta-like n=1 Tax=Sardina pilchardus TaxID=27697 RepID=UPI002E106561